MSGFPVIPTIEDDDFLEAVSALTRAAETFKTVATILLLEKTEKGVQMMMTHGDHLELCEEVINAWSKHLGIEDETAIQ
ncbi:MAG: hypothetical protein MK137_05900 [Rickettsiales bacterium]|nr:hypothetical protein [Rickettsiales bacterium]